MSDTVTLDSTGRVVIPKGLRDELNLEAGDKLTVETDGEKVVLARVRSEDRMRKKNGIWVFHGGGPITTEDANRVLDQIRREREHSFLGVKK